MRVYTFSPFPGLLYVPRLLPYFSRIDRYLKCSGSNDGGSGGGSDGGNSSRNRERERVREMVRMRIIARERKRASKAREKGAM